MRPGLWLAWRPERRYSASVAKGARKLKRAASRDTTAAKAKKAQLKQPYSSQPGEIPDPLGAPQLKAMLLRLGLPLAGVWIVCAFIYGFTLSPTARAFALGVPSVITLGLLGLVVWALAQAKKAKGVAGILREAQSSDDRNAAIEKLEKGFKKKDPAAIFARAQLELQEDPRKALATLEQINVEKVMAPIADEARAQRAMIHLMLGEVNLARQLADNVDLKRHQEPKTRAMLASVVAEAWSRSGQAKKGLETLNLFDPEDEVYADLRPQLYRAYAYAYAHTSDIKGVRRVLKKLLVQDVRLLGAFMMKKTHPLLQKEAKKLAEQSGQVPRKMQVQRMR